MSIVIEALTERHDRSEFDSRSELLDRYLRQLASQDARRGVARVFVAVRDGDPKVVGFYTLSAASIERSELPPEAARRLPYYPIPAALIGRLAVDRRWRGQRLGFALLADAIRRVMRTSKDLAVFAIIVDAKDVHAQTFYERFGFKRLPDSGQRLFCPVDLAEHIIEY